MNTTKAKRRTIDPSWWEMVLLFLSGIFLLGSFVMQMTEAGHPVKAVAKEGDDSPKNLRVQHGQ